MRLKLQCHTNQFIFHLNVKTKISPIPLEPQGPMPSVNSLFRSFALLTRGANPFLPQDCWVYQL